MNVSNPTGPGLNFSGLASGLDSNAIVDALIQFERRPLKLLEARKSNLQSQQNLLRNLNTQLLALRDAAAAVDNQSASLAGPSLDEELLAYQASSSNESLLQADAGTGAQAGSHSIEVVALADVARRTSVAFADANTSIAPTAATFTVDFGASQQISLSVAAGTTLTQLRDAINQDPANDGSVKADLLFDGTGYRLNVTGTNVGAANDVTVTTDLVGPASEPFVAINQSASDAQLNYLGLSVTRGSNDITDLIPGVTLHLRGAQAGTTVTVDVVRDDTEIANRLRGLVDAYNAIRDFSIQQSKVDPNTNQGGVLSGDAFVRGIEGTLQRTLGDLYPFTGNPFGSLGQIGIRFDDTGHLTLDEQVLSGALDSDPSAVRQLLSGDGTTDGAATALGRALEPLVRSGDGALALRDSSFDDRVQDLDRQITSFESRLQKREETLRLRFSRLESLVSSLQGQSSFLSSISTGSSK